MTTMLSSSHVYNRNLSTKHGGGQSIFAWREGRRYHNDKDAVYPLPCDLRELDRMNFTHYLFHHIFNKHFVAPFHDPESAPKKVLDVGCGTGVWILEADKAFKQMASSLREREYISQFRDVTTWNLSE
ncbi:hypothetical protein NEOLI_002631 [Neolecta irregularis DAH-3]|uniref:Methyltransferase domain-containing protein n=1 Tax=Neolecta irregularis (strain DAH-3) TaxID=1198029 RepID=A0A1U7LQG2_NEOID|nr:hypothetical protein NEOLI_002631 [Neolecta irregularis DAH-3]|eukprot:OLL24884.1 hypothetical protein NEOLI_002631 [Neolecta irregularis DAH-3]